MIRLNVHEAKTHLSRYLDAVEAGEVVILCRRNVPVAELRRVPQACEQPRPLGLARARFGPMELPDAFFEALPEEVIAGFEGRAS